jgi:hypothetical protein
MDINLKKIYFLDGPGGTGKTFLLNCIINRIRSENKIVLVVASSGIASTLLPGGRTAHSRFKIPFKLFDNSVCSIKQNSLLSELLKQTSLIIWDEAPMLHKNGFIAVDRSLKDIYNNNIIFGGITTLLSGDFRQLLPVTPNATEGQIIQSTIKECYLWEHIIKLKLKTNMRTENDDFSKYLLQLGEGIIQEKYNNNNDYIKISNYINNLDNTTTTINTLIDLIYPDINNLSNDDISNRIILTLKNDDVDTINNIILNKLNNKDAFTYNSYDCVDDLQTTNINLYTTEFLNSLTVNGLPPHRLQLKINTPIILLRNINQSIG